MRLWLLYLLYYTYYTYYTTPTTPTTLHLQVQRLALRAAAALLLPLQFGFALLLPQLPLVGLLRGSVRMVRVVRVRGRGKVRVSSFRSSACQPKLQ